VKAKINGCGLKVHLNGPVVFFAFSREQDKNSKSDTLKGLKSVPAYVVIAYRFITALRKLLIFSFLYKPV